MLKGFFLFVFIAAGVALVAIQFTTPDKPIQTKIEEPTETAINEQDMVFYKLIRPEDPLAQKQNEEEATPQKPTCTTDLECETSLKVSAFNLIVSDAITTLTNDVGGRPNSQAPDLQASVVNKNEVINLNKDDEILDLIDNLADLQQEIEDKPKNIYQ